MYAYMYVCMYGYQLTVIIMQQNRWRNFFRNSKKLLTEKYKSAFWNWTKAVRKDYLIFLKMEPNFFEISWFKGPTQIFHKTRFLVLFNVPCLYIWRSKLSEKKLYTLKHCVTIIKRFTSNLQLVISANIIPSLFYVYRIRW